MKAANRVLKTVSDRTLIRLSSGLGTYIPAGHCRLCARCSCRRGLPCVHEKDVRYSFESLGVSVGDVAEKFFGEKLCWYHMRAKDENTGAFPETDLSAGLPAETAVYGALLTNEDISCASLMSSFSDVILL